jgi:hypothetical protein
MVLSMNPMLKSLLPGGRQELLWYLTSPYLFLTIPLAFVAVITAPVAPAAAAKDAKKQVTISAKNSTVTVDVTTTRRHRAIRSKH